MEGVAGNNVPKSHTELTIGPWPFQTAGWWEQPNRLHDTEGGTGAAVVWKFHPFTFASKKITLEGGWWPSAMMGRNSPYTPPRRWYSDGGSQMHAYDVNGDGLQDVITSLDAHGYGLAWYEASRDASQGFQFIP